MPEPRNANIASVLTFDEARRIAVNVAKLVCTENLVRVCLAEGIT
jgi:hypothetical protein